LAQAHGLRLKLIARGTGVIGGPDAAAFASSAEGAFDHASGSPTKHHELGPRNRRVTGRNRWQWRGGVYLA
jgi:hypothetical protein